VAGDQVLTDQPALNFWRRVQDVIFRLFSKNLYRSAIQPPSSLGCGV
jgi:hypothetical protein